MLSKTSKREGELDERVRGNKNSSDHGVEMLACNHVDLFLFACALSVIC